MENNSTNNVETCENCGTEVSSDEKFCTSCGKPIDTSDSLKSSDVIICPDCNSEIPPGKKFCTNCGKSLETGTDPGSSSSKNYINVDDSLNSLKKSGKGLMKGMGGFLDKTAAKIDDSVNKKESSSNESISEALQKKRDKVESNPGYLVCDGCGGYYELQQGEEPGDFSDECECGGTLKHQETFE